MTAADGQGRINRKERLARAVLGMPAGHPELLTRKPDRAEWKLLPRGARSCGRVTSTRRSSQRLGGRAGHQGRKAGGDHCGSEYR